MRIRMLVTSFAIAALVGACDTTAAVGDGSDTGIAQADDGGTAASSDATTSAPADTGISGTSDAAASTNVDAGLAAGPDASSGAPGHTESRGGVLHRPGATDPLTNCVSCHGADLTGGSGPSCYSCHNSNDHTLQRKGGVMHRSGTSASCNTCHGPGNSGGLGPACTQCH